MYVENFQQFLKTNSIRISAIYAKKKLSKNDSIMKKKNLQKPL